VIINLSIEIIKEDKMPKKIYKKIPVKAKKYKAKKLKGIKAK